MPSLKQKEIKSARSMSCGLYHATVIHDEVWPYLDGTSWRRWQEGWSSAPTLEVHHILGRGQEVNERRSNLILVSGCSHGWGHDLCPNEFLIACLYAKWQKEQYRIALDAGGSPEWDAATLEEILGVPLQGWLEFKRDSVEGEYAGYAEEMIRWLRSIK